MTDESFKRKLTAILSADVEGYSRLMGDDEEATVRTLTSYREVIATLIKQHNGTVVDSPGDNLLAEFVSVVDAVQCAVAVQKEIKARNNELPENRRMQFRIGINLGDVIQEKERIYGDGVNIAARLEALSDPGGICISKTAFDHIESKLPYGYEFLGDQTVKNIPKPVGAYRVVMEPRVTVAEENEEEVIPFWRWKAAIGGAIAGLVVIISVAVLWNVYWRAPKIEPASVERMAFALPEKPSIAVLPFENIGEDPKQAFFSDGITDDLITDLSKVSGLFVIARNSVFTYKGKPVKVQQIAEELSVRYVLEGSVRRAGDKLRVNAQLIDAITGHHLWAERYDGDMGDVFALQDRITRKIVAAVAVEMTAGEQEQLELKQTDNVQAYDAFLQGREHYFRRTPEDFVKAVRYFEKAIELDPDYSLAYAALALTYWESQHNFWNQSLGVSWYNARQRAEGYQRMAMKKPTALAHQVASKILVDRHEHEAALAEAQRAITLDPNDADSYLAMAYALIHIGRAKEAFDFVEKATRLNPHYPAYYLYVLGLAHFGMEQFNQAATCFERALKRNPLNIMPLIPLAAAYAYLGRQNEAEAAISKLAKALPRISQRFLGEPILFAYKDPGDKDRLLEGLRKAGLAGSPYDTLRQAGKN